MNNIEILTKIADSIKFCRRMNDEIKNRFDIEKPIVKEYLRKFNNVDLDSKIFYNFGVEESRSQNYAFTKIIGAAFPELRDKYIKIINYKVNGLMVQINGKLMDLDENYGDIIRFIRYMLRTYKDENFGLALKKHVADNRFKDIERDF